MRQAATLFLLLATLAAKASLVQWFKLDEGAFDPATNKVHSAVSSATGTTNGYYGKSVPSGNLGWATAGLAPVALIPPTNNGCGTLGALSLIGTNAILTTAGGVLGDATVPRSVAAWIRMAGTPTANATIVGWGPNSTGQRFDLRISASGSAWVPRAEVSGGGFSGTYDVGDGNWHHVALAYSSGGNAAIYVDGALDTAGTLAIASTLPTSSTNILIGDSYAGTSSNSRKFTGQIDDVRIYNHALSLSEIQALALAPAITNRMTNQFVGCGGSATFNAAIGQFANSTMTYTWTTNNVVMAGATDSSMIWNNVQSCGSVQEVAVVAANPYGSATNTCTLTVQSSGPPAITVPLSNQTVQCGSNATFIAAASGAAPLIYTWKVNDTPVCSGTDLTSFTTNNVHAAGSSYTIAVMVTNASGGNSSTATLTVTDTIGPAITVTGPNCLWVIKGGAYTELGATATDSCSGAVPIAATNGTVNVNLAGTYPITYTASDGNLNISTATRTVVVTDAGVWTNTGGGNWGDSDNWANAVVAQGSGNTADFSQAKITADTTVHLDFAATIGNLTFSAPAPGSAASWILDNNGTPANMLTLAVSNGSPAVTVNALGAGASAIINAVVAGTNGLTKLGSGTLTLGGANTFTGTTVVSNGTLVVKNSLAGGVNVTSGGTLAGGGVIAGPVSVAGVLAPGPSMGVLTVRNSLSLSGQTVLEIGKSRATPVSDQLAGMTTVNYGGSLVVTNRSNAPLAQGDSFTLFTAGTRSGTFANLTLPRLAQGLSWVTKLAVDGSISIVTNGLPILGTNANLVTLSLNCGPLTPAFAPAVVNYTLSVPYGTNSATLTPVSADINAAIQMIWGGVTNTVLSGAASLPLALVPGANVIAVRVTSQDTMSTKDYVVTITREANPVTTKPNILFILCDDLGYGDVGVFFQNARAAANNRSKPWHLTPKLDNLAAEGVQMRQHYCGAPVCAPARSSLLLGVTQGHANVRDNEFDYALENNHTLATVLKMAGYETVAIGKWGLQGTGGSKPTTWPAYPTKRGFDYYYGYVRHADGHEHYPKEGIYKGAKQVWDMTNEVSTILDKCYTADLWTARAKKWILDHQATNSGAPFFMYLAYDTPHSAAELPTQAYPAGAGTNGGLQWLGTPGNMINTANGTVDSYLYPQYINATWDKDKNPSTPEVAWPEDYKRFASSINRLDECIGDLQQLLKDLNLDTNTIVVFTSDNGPTIESYIPGQSHGADFFDSFGPFDGVKRDCWEGGVRVPTIAYWPGHITPGTTNWVPSGSWDWMATFAEAAGLPCPARCDGVSLLPSLTGAGVQRAPTVYSEYYVSGTTPSYSEFMPAHRGRTRNQMQLIRFGDLLGVRYNILSQDDNFEIYNVVTDPQETINLATNASYAALQQQMKDTVLGSRRPSSDAPRPYDTNCVPAVAASPVVAGVAWRAYTNSFPWVPELTALTSSSRGTAVLPSLDVRPSDNNIGMLFSGYLNVPSDGSYTFYLSVDTGALLRLHAATVVDADYGYVGGTENSGTILLKAGLHPFRLYYARGTNGSPALSFQWSGPGIAKEPVPASLFLQDPSTNARLSSLSVSSGSLTPVWNPNLAAYSASVPYASTPTVTATSADSSATLQLSFNGGAFSPLTSGVASGPLRLATLGSLNTVDVKVTAQSAGYAQDYIVTLTQQPSLTRPMITNSRNGTNLVLGWPSDHLGYRLLQQINNLNGLSLNPADWQEVPGSITTTTATLPLSQTNKSDFYRLVYP